MIYSYKKEIPISRRKIPHILFQTKRTFQKKHSLPGMRLPMPSRESRPVQGDAKPGAAPDLILFSKLNQLVHLI